MSLKQSVIGISDKILLSGIGKKCAPGCVKHVLFIDNRLIYNGEDPRR